MKRQPKPFSVEIKRSRRSPAPSPSSSPSLVDGGRIDADKAASRRKRTAKAESEAELVVPAFLKSDKGNIRSTTKAIAKERESVFATKTTSPVFERQAPAEGKASDERDPRQILPSLTSGYGVAPQMVEEPKGRSRKAAVGEEAKEARTSRRKENEKAPSARTSSPRAESGSRQKSPAQQGSRAGLQSSPARKQGPAAETDVPTAQARFGQRALISVTAATAAQGEGARGQSKRRRLLKRNRDEAAFLPRGERWKRRIHPRAW